MRIVSIESARGVTCLLLFPVKDAEQGDLGGQRFGKPHTTTVWLGGFSGRQGYTNITPCSRDGTTTEADHTRFAKHARNTELIIFSNLKLGYMLQGCLDRTPPRN